MIRFLLFPFSFLFGIITCLRNKLYDWKIIPSVRYDDIFVISVGNISVGGTGKTSFVEYLIRLLSQRYRVAVLSRGYMRTTKGFRLADDNATPEGLGDEPYQIKRKFPDIVVAVDTDRVRGIAEIRKKFPEMQVILLDDAFQYRKITPNLSILLADYNRPMYLDGMLPGGRLREWTCFAKRADIMVVSKSPAEMTPDEKQEIERRYSRIFPHELFFTTIDYGKPIAVFSGNKPLSISDIKGCDVLLLTGIANPKPFETYIRRHAASVQTVTFGDHHAFSEKDITMIVEKWNKIPSSNKLLITTEKDAVRLQPMKIPEIISKHIYYIPIEVCFTGNNQDVFSEKLMFRACQIIYTF